MISAEQGKVFLIDFLLPRFPPGSIIGNEIMYGTKKKVVDLVIIKAGKTTAIEIKADGDDLRRVKHQTEEYKKVFDFVIVFTTETHLKRVVASVTEDVGVYAHEGQTIKIVRPPKRQKSLDKEEMLFSMTAKYLRKNLCAKEKKLDPDSLRAFYAKKSLQTIQQLFRDYLYKKIEVRYKLFLQNRGTTTHIDDIPVLSSCLYIQ
jgi:Holliday junction resolvase